MKIIHTVMAGGIGSRLWPLSRKAHPKQFLNIASSKPMVAETFLRYKNLNISSNVVLSNEEHKFLVKDALKSCNIKADIILEPEGKNTAPAAILASLHVIDKFDDALILLSPSDHVLNNIEDLERRINECIEYANQGYICTFGITPDLPETGYGYIQTDKNLNGKKNIFSIKSFKEKPTKSKAEKYLDEDNYLWNSGIFLFKASSLINEITKYSPDMVKSCHQAYKLNRIDKDFYSIDKDSFDICPDDSLDYALMEKTKNGIVAKIDVNWSDLGSWKSIWDFKEKDNSGNVLEGDIIALETQNCYVKSDSKHLISTIGIDNLAIIQTNDALLVADINKSQQVKTLVKQLKREQREEYICHREVHRPWGMFDSIDSSDRYQVKRITVKPGHKLSVQMHYHRAEHWIVVGGTALVRKGFDKDNLKEHLLRENESIYIEIGEIHSLENPGKFPLELIEVQSGAYLGEDDIVRFSDVYGRNDD